MQKLFIIGRLTADPEQRVTPSGISVCSFTVAVDRRFPVNGEMVTDFYRVSAWRQIGDNCAKYLSKGKKVAVMGELQARTYEDKTGKTRVSLDVSADEVEFLSPKGEAPQAAPRDDLPGFANLPEDELPFD